VVNSSYKRGVYGVTLTAPSSDVTRRGAQQLGGWQRGEANTCYLQQLLKQAAAIRTVIIATSNLVAAGNCMDSSGGYIVAS